MQRIVTQAWFIAGSAIVAIKIIDQTIIAEDQRVVGIQSIIARATHDHIATAIAAGQVIAIACIDYIEPPPPEIVSLPPNA